MSYLSDMRPITDSELELIEKNQWKSVDRYDIIMMTKMITDEDVEYFSKILDIEKDIESF